MLGHHRQFVPSNWKFYAENTKDPYHASLLHLFHMTFGLYRSSQEGGVRVTNKWHTVLFSKAGTDSDDAINETEDAKLRTYDSGYRLADMSLLAGRKEFDDNVTLVIISLMPTLVIQQMQNTLAVRQILPKSESEFELIWTYCPSGSGTGSRTPEWWFRSPDDRDPRCCVRPFQCTRPRSDRAPPLAGR